MREAWIRKLEEIVDEKNSHDNGYHYKAVVNDWNNYGKSRTYFSIIETRDNSKHCNETRYGFFDNNSGIYVPAKYAKLM